MYKVISKIIMILLALISLVTMAQLPRATLEINHHQISVELAKTTEEHEQGLSGRKLLPKNTGMYFIFPELSRHYFWMKDMNFPLDMVWIRQGKIVGITANVPPPVSKDLPIYPSAGLVDAVLEINAGEAAAAGLKVGNKVEILQ